MEPNNELQRTLPLARILIVEDDVLTRMALAEDLRDAGYSVVEASNADEAMAYLNAAVGYLNPESQIDLVFADIRMPGSMDGLELARRLRVERPQLPVILSSGGTARVANFIAKPYRMEQVLSVISKTLWPE
jgi:CheY-like chemotaxis protein